MTDASRWRTVCAYYFDDAGKDDLLLDVVRPLLDRLTGADGDSGGDVEAAYFLRHWRRGPHLRLNFRTTEDAMNRRVLPAVDLAVGGFLRERPSVSGLDPYALLPAYRRLAEAEHEELPLWPPRPDNFLCTEAYDSRARVLGGEAPAAFVADFYTAANPAAFAALEAVREERQRLWTAFELMVVTAHVFSGCEVRRGFVSYRAHADTYLARAADQGRVRTEWDRIYRAARPALHARLDRVVSDVTGAGHLRAWTAALTAVRERGFALADSGALTMDHASRPSAGTTAFLEDLLASEDFRLRMKPSAAFRHYRLVLNLLYLQLTRIGIRAAERYLLGHLVARTVEEFYGVDAATVMREEAARVGGGASS